MTMITPSYLGETIEYSSLHACRSTLEDPTYSALRCDFPWLGRRDRSRDGLIDWTRQNLIGTEQRTGFDGERFHDTDLPQEQVVGKRKEKSRA